jgi:hypothetical protein
LEGYARYAKVSTDEAWRRLLKGKLWAEQDKVSGYIGSKLFKKDEFEDLVMVSQDRFIYEGISELNYEDNGQAQY